MTSDDTVMVAAYQRVLATTQRKLKEKDALIDEMGAKLSASQRECVQLSADLNYRCELLRASRAMYSVLRLKVQVLLSLRGNLETVTGELVDLVDTPD